MFSVAIYYWAMAVALPTEEIEQMVNEVVPDEEEGRSSLPGPNAIRARWADGSGTPGCCPPGHT